MKLTNVLLTIILALLCAGIYEQHREFAMQKAELARQDAQRQHAETLATVQATADYNYWEFQVKSCQAVGSLFPDRAVAQTAQRDCLQEAFYVWVVEHKPVR